MIEAVTQDTLPRLEALLTQNDWLGMRMASALRCYGPKSDVCRFFLATSAEDSPLRTSTPPDGLSCAALMVLGSGALLCARAQYVPNVEELERFLSFARVKCFQTTAAPLTTWRMVPQLLMRHRGAPELIVSAEVEDAPNLWQLVHSDLFVSAPSSSTAPVPVAPDDWYADTCLRVNRGEADVRAIRVQGRYVSTAGVYGIGPRSVYLTAVATETGFRGCGFACTLVSTLCAAYADRDVYLLCAPPLRTFYERLGFALTLPVCVFEAPSVGVL